MEFAQSVRGTPFSRDIGMNGLYLHNVCNEMSADKVIGKYMAV